MGVLATSVCADVMYAIGLKKKELAAVDALNTTTAVEEVQGDASIKSGTDTLVTSPGIYSPAVLLDKTSLVDTRKNPGKYPTVKIKTFIERIGRREDFELKRTGMKASDNADTSKHAGMDSVIEKEKSSHSSVLVEI